jgi:hypothetical protein
MLIDGDQLKPGAFEGRQAVAEAVVTETLVPNQQPRG